MVNLQEYFLFKDPQKVPDNFLISIRLSIIWYLFEAQIIIRTTNINELGPVFVIIHT